jgi:hypothetical protein
MKKCLLLLCFSICMLSVTAQKIVKIEKVTDHSTHIVGSNFEGVIFSKEYSTFPLPNDVVNFPRFTPLPEDVLAAEKLLVVGIDNSSKKNGYAAFIRKYLKKYYHQYFGYVNKENEKVIFINCFPKKDEFFNEKIDDQNKKTANPRWQTEIVQVLDGGTSFWQIKINLNTQQAFDFGVNGFG